MERDLAVTDLAEEEHRLAHRVVDGERQLVLGELLLDRLTHDVLGAEEAIRGHQTAERLVRSEVVVEGEEVREPLAGVGQFLRMDTLPELA